jgi:hypothetical protein
VVAICEDGGVQPERVALLEIGGHERFSVNKIIGAHTAAHKSNNDELLNGPGGGCIQDRHTHTRKRRRRNRAFWSRTGSQHIFRMRRRTYKEEKGKQPCGRCRPAEASETRLAR